MIQQHAHALPGSKDTENPFARIILSALQRLSDKRKREKKLVYISNQTFLVSSILKAFPCNMELYVNFYTHSRTILKHHWLGVFA